MKYEDEGLINVIQERKVIEVGECAERKKRRGMGFMMLDCKYAHLIETDDAGLHIYAEEV